jgi:hypothetical protein
MQARDRSNSCGLRHKVLTLSRPGQPNVSASVAALHDGTKRRRLQAVVGLLSGLKLSPEENYYFRLAKEWPAYKGRLSMHQPGGDPQANCAHHQQHSVHSARIQPLL